MRTSLLWGSSVVVALAGLPASAQENPFDTAVDARMGRRVFNTECGRCHGLDGKGNDETGAPDLTTGSFANASSDQALFEVIRDGVPGTTMVGISWAPDQTVWQVVAYVNSLSIDPGSYDLPGDTARGRELFTGKGECARCHMVAGRGGRLGPDLSAVANRRKPDELTQDLIDPDAEVAPRWWTVRVTRNDGTVVEGPRMDEDTFTLRIMDEDENLWHFAKSEILSIERIEASTMPSVTDTLTESEIDDLVAYLFSLRKES
jgi:putative heme-binding domain-containing protein